jgi:hypothetical protein
MIRRVFVSEAALGLARGMKKPRRPSRRGFMGFHR